MAKGNRTENAALITALAATIDISELKVALNGMNDSAIYNEDVIGTGSYAVSGNVDYTGYDYFVATITASSVVLGFTNITQGEEKYLKIVNASLFTFAFTGVTDHTVSDSLYATNGNFYLLWNKDGNVHIKPLTKDVLSASNAIMQTGTATSSFATPVSTKYVTRHGYKLLSNAESYAVEDGVGLIEIPSGVTGGTITMPNPANFAGHKIIVYSTGGSGVYVNQYTGTPINIFTANYYQILVGNGTTWTSIENEARS